MQDLSEPVRLVRAINPKEPYIFTPRHDDVGVSVACGRRVTGG